MKIKLGSIEPNPFKKHIEGGKIDPARVEKVLESADRNEFWHGWHVRETVDGHYQLLWGHHRLAAAVKLFGKDFEVSATLHDLTDEQMFSSLANENVKDDNPQEKTDVVEFAQKYLAEHPESCKGLGGSREPASQREKQAATQHVHGSAQCIASFLGEKNWPLATIKRYMRIATLPADIRGKVAPPTGSRKDVGHGIKPGELRQNDAVALSYLTPSAQKAAVSTIIEVNSKDAADPVIIPSAEVKRIVEEVKSLPDKEQAKAVARKLEAAGAQAKRDKEERRKQAPPSSSAAPIAKKHEKNLVAMAERIIKEGQRALAAKLHPDKGGSNADMAELNAAVGWLRSLISRP